jgi:hypothetical protein
MGKRRAGNPPRLQGSLNDAAANCDAPEGSGRETRFHTLAASGTLRPSDPRPLPEPTGLLVDVRPQVGRPGRAPNPAGASIARLATSRGSRACTIQRSDRQPRAAVAPVAPPRNAVVPGHRARSRDPSFNPPAGDRRYEICRRTSSLQCSTPTLPQRLHQGSGRPTRAEAAARPATRCATRRCASAGRGSASKRPRATRLRPGSRPARCRGDRPARPPAAAS